GAGQEEPRPHDAGDRHHREAALDPPGGHGHAGDGEHLRPREPLPHEAGRENEGPQGPPRSDEDEPRSERSRGEEEGARALRGGGGGGPGGWGGGGGAHGERGGARREGGAAAPGGGGSRKPRARRARAWGGRRRRTRGRRSPETSVPARWATASAPRVREASRR